MIVNPAVMIAATMTRATRVSIERDQELVDRIRELERRPDTAITALRPACLALADSSATHARVTAVSRIYDASQLPRPAKWRSVRSTCPRPPKAVESSRLPG